MLDCLRGCWEKSLRSETDKKLCLGILFTYFFIAEHFSYWLNGFPTWGKMPILINRDINLSIPASYKR